LGAGEDERVTDFVQSNRRARRKAQEDAAAGDREGRAAESFFRPG